MWKDKIINLGNIRVKSTNKVIFEYIGSNIKIINITVSCGCTSYKFNDTNNTIEVTYIPSPVPRHIKEAGHNEYYSNKFINVTYENHEAINITESLIINATVKEII